MQAPGVGPRQLGGLSYRLLHGIVGVQAGEADGAALEGAQVDEHEGARRAEVWQRDDAHALAVVALDERLRVRGLVGGKVDVRALLARVRVKGEW